MYVCMYVVMVYVCSSVCMYVCSRVEEEETFGRQAGRRAGGQRGREGQECFGASLCRERWVKKPDTRGAGISRFCRVKIKSRDFLDGLR